MKWQHFFGIWTAVFSITAFFSFFAVGFAASEDHTSCANSFDKRLWLIPSVLILLAACFGSVTALLVA